MPYIKEENRNNLDIAIANIANKIKENGQYYVNQQMKEDRLLSNEELATVLGDINYCVSRIISILMGRPSYPKIAMITGVLENIKQEYYRRVAQSYEDKKLIENGDIHEYKHFT